MEFETLKKKLGCSELLIFFDLEATQINHKAIAFAMVCANKNKDEITFNKNDGFTYFNYIKTEDEIGPIVEEMTGIHKNILDEKGISFHQAVIEISKVLRPYKYRKFISYGNTDLEILSKSIDNNNETEVNFFRNITKNYLDFHSYIMQRIVDSKGSSYSLKALADKYGIHEKGKPHDPLFDSLLLRDIFLSYVQEEDKTLAFALEHYKNNKCFSAINRQLALMLLEKGEVKKEELISLLEEYL